MRAITTAGPARRTTALLAASALVAATAVAATVGTADPADAQAVTDPCRGAPRAPFVDVPDRGTHTPSIDCLAGLGVLGGTAVDAFRPGAVVRRDQMATIVAGAIRAAGGQLPTGSRSTFGDVSGSVHRDAIEALAAAGIVQGDGGRYRPAAIVGRGQMATFLVGAHDHLRGGPPTTPPEAPDAFEDDDGHTHERSIDRAAHLQLLSGRTATTFDPDGVTAREQTATFAARLLAGAARDGLMAAPSWGFRDRVSELSPALRRTMTGTTWRSGCPVGLGDLRLLEITHRGFDGRDRIGLLVLHRDATAVVRAALRDAYDAGFRIERMRLMDRYGGDDDRSMADNNSSAFNCRPVAGSSTWSQHALGRAIDLNPVQNPYVRASTVLPAAGRAYLDRSDVRTGMLTANGATVRAFESRGWSPWGGRWNSLKDYQHFSATGR